MPGDVVMSQSPGIICSYVRFRFFLTLGGNFTDNSSFMERLCNEQRYWQILIVEWASNRAS